MHAHTHRMSEAIKNMLATFTGATPPANEKTATEPETEPEPETNGKASPSKKRARDDDDDDGAINGNADESEEDDEPEDDEPEAAAAPPATALVMEEDDDSEDEDVNSQNLNPSSGEEDDDEDEDEEDDEEETPPSPPPSKKEEEPKKKRARRTKAVNPSEVAVPKTKADSVSGRKSRRILTSTLGNLTRMCGQLFKSSGSVESTLQRFLGKPEKWAMSKRATVELGGSAVVVAAVAAANDTNKSMSVTAKKMAGAGAGAGAGGDTYMSAVSTLDIHTNAGDNAVADAINYLTRGLKMNGEFLVVKMNKPEGYTVGDKVLSESYVAKFTTRAPGASVAGSPAITVFMYDSVPVRIFLYSSPPPSGSYCEQAYAWPACRGTFITPGAFSVTEVTTAVTEIQLSPRVADAATGKEFVVRSKTDGAVFDPGAEDVVHTEAVHLVEALLEDGIEVALLPETSIPGIGTGDDESVHFFKNAKTQDPLPRFTDDASREEFLA